MIDNPTVESEIKTSANIYCKPKVIAEWNYNRYVKVTADNTLPVEADNAADPDLFPIESITKPNRPTRKSAKFLAGESYLYDPNSVNETRYVVASEDDYYKYWISQYITGQTSLDSFGTTLPSPAVDANHFPANADGTSTTFPYIQYDSPVKANYIVIKMQNSFATPNDYTVYIDGVAVASPVIDSDGRIRLYYDGAKWSATESNMDTVMVTKISMEVRSLAAGADGGDGTDSHFQLIEISARLRSDISEYVIDTETNYDLGSPSELYPVGTITTNVASYDISNTDGTFSNDNPNSPFNGLIQKNAKLILSYLYSFDGGQTYTEEIGDGIWYVDTWSPSGDYQLNVSCSDYAKYLQTAVPPKMLMKDQTFSQIAVRVLDAVGFNNHNIYQTASNDVIPIFWTNGEDNVWQILDDLANATQTAIYFDRSGILNVKTRDYAFTNQAPVWTSVGQSSPDQLTDISAFSKSSDDEPNHIIVEYTPTEWNTGRYGVPNTDQVWQPEGDEVLRSVPLISDLGTSDRFICMSSKNATAWPFESKVQIETEMIGVYGKEYQYWDGAVKHTKVIYSLDEQNDLDKLQVPGRSWTNKYTGKLQIALNNDDLDKDNYSVSSKNYTDARAMENTANGSPKAHKAGAANYDVRARIGGQTIQGAGGVLRVKRKKKIKRRGHRTRIKHYVIKKRIRPKNNLNARDSSSQLNMHTGYNYRTSRDLLVATRGAPKDIMMRHWGTTLEFVKDSSCKMQEAGIVIASDTGENGYYISVKTTNKITTKLRKNRNEIVVYARENDKLHKVSPGKGYKHAVAAGVPIEIDVDFNTAGGDHNINVSVNGTPVMRFDVPDKYKVPMHGRFGLFAAGSTNVNFDYLYAVNDNTEDMYIPDGFSFFDIEEGAFMGQRFQREWVWQHRYGNRRIHRKIRRTSWKRQIYFYDEFGPMIHEVRDYDVQFDPNPVAYSQLFLSNDSQAICTQYSATPFGAKFRIYNTSRSNAIINGDDDDVNQILTVLGRTVITTDVANVTSQNDQSVITNGEVDATLSSQWIQSKDMAQKVADWMKDHWASYGGSMSLTIFGNPLIEATDIINVNYAEEYINQDYYVTGVKKSFNNGLTTDLTLRAKV